METFWPEFEARMEEMRSVRSGDIVLVMDTTSGYMTVMAHDQYNGWHGGPLDSESEVPLIFGFLGTDKSFLQTAVNEVRSSWPAGSALRNYHLAEIVPRIVGKLTQAPPQ